MLLKLLALFILIPLVELILLLVLAHYTSITVTLLTVIATGVAGTLLARSQGWRTMLTIQRELAHGQLPTSSLLDAALIFCAGALLLTPGLLTDAFGLSMLAPAIRRHYRAAFSRWIRAHFRVGPIGSFDTESTGGRADVFDAPVVDRNPNND